MVRKKAATKSNSASKTTDTNNSDLRDLINKLKKEHGDDSVMLLGDEPMKDIPVYPSGSLALDHALGRGYPHGRVIEMFGPEGSGKTTLLLHLIAQAQNQGRNCAFIDAEHALSPQFAERIGVDTKNLLISQPTSGEQALQLAQKLVQSGLFGVVGVDSVAALVPEAELKGEIGDAHVGLQARLMSGALRQLSAIAAKSGTIVVFVNQLREKIGVTFGSNETTPGGRALRFYSSVRLDVRRIGSIKDGDEVIGNRTKVKVVKNKVSPPFRVAEFDIMYNEGIGASGELVDYGVEHGLIEKAGSWFSYNGERIGQGRETAKKFFIENQKEAEKLRRLIKEKMGVSLDEDDTPKESANEDVAEPPAE